MNPGADNKAKLLPLGPDGASAGDPITVQFNPATYSTLWNIGWNEVGQSLQWSRSYPSDLVLTLNYDSYEARTDVRDKTKDFKERLDPDQAGSGQAVGCLFQWGKLSYQGVVESIKEDLTLFLTDGTPVRSLITLTLKPWPPAA
jgi:hypothetical protein